MAMEDFIDIDFSRITEYEKGDLGPPPPDVFADYEEALGVIDEEAWDEIIEEINKKKLGIVELVPHIYNQGKEGTCTSNATCAAMNLIASLQFGDNRIPILSPISLYKRVAPGPNTGSSVKDNVDEAMARGVLPLDSYKEKFKHTMPAVGYRNRMPDNWQETAELFRIGEVYVCRDYRAVVSAILRGHPVIVGRQGHAILYVSVRRDNRRRLIVDYQNSWGNWGYGMGKFSYGFGGDSFDNLRRASQWAVAVRSIEYSKWSLLE
ncbi:MAG: hypothetical protein KatS3mg087_1193 [Patescibacteria group bacterium]|nr:MAG: hypothetical protein KatS3mg087_1193 [Patescibacteria group bacterium]